MDVYSLTQTVYNKLLPQFAPPPAPAAKNPSHGQEGASPPHSRGNSDNNSDNREEEEKAAEDMMMSVADHNAVGEDGQKEFGTEKISLNDDAAEINTTVVTDDIAPLPELQEEEKSDKNKEENKEVESVQEEPKIEEKSNGSDRDNITSGDVKTAAFQLALEQSAPSS